MGKRPGLGHLAIALIAAIAFACGATPAAAPAARPAAPASVGAQPILVAAGEEGHTAGWDIAPVLVTWTSQYMPQPAYAWLRAVIRLRPRTPAAPDLDESQIALLGPGDVIRFDEGASDRLVALTGAGRLYAFRPAMAHAREAGAALTAWSFVVPRAIVGCASGPPACVGQAPTLGPLLLAVTDPAPLLFSLGRASPFSLPPPPTPRPPPLSAAAATVPQVAVRTPVERPTPRPTPIPYTPTPAPESAAAPTAGPTPTPAPEAATEPRLVPTVEPTPPPLVPSAPLPAAPPAAPQAARIAIDPPSAFLTVSQLQPFSATVYDAQGNVLPGRLVGWSIAGPGSISAMGLFASAAIVSATLTGDFVDVNAAVDGQVLGHALVHIGAPTVKIAPLGAVRSAQPIQLAAGVTFNGQPLTNVPVTWLVSSPQLGTVTRAGLFTPGATGVVGCVVALAGVTPPATLACGGTLIGADIASFAILP